jgi:hypothetical protein
VILTSQWGAMTYAFVCWEEAFIVFASVLGVFTVIVVIGPMFKAFHHQKYRVPRALLYVLLSVVFPVTWWLMLSVKHGFACRAVVVEFYQVMRAFATFLNELFKKKKKKKKKKKPKWGGGGLFCKKK